MIHQDTLYRWLLSLLVLFSAGLSQAKDVPPLKERITDEAHLFSNDEKSQLESQIIAFEKEYKGAQLAVLTVESLEGEKLEAYTLKVANTWGLGDQHLNNGILIFAALEERAVRIEVGKGLEKILSEDVAKKILDQKLIPAFKEGQYYQGVSRGISALSFELDLDPSDELHQINLAYLLYGTMMALFLGALIRKDPWKTFYKTKFLPGSISGVSSIFLLGTETLGGMIITGIIGGMFGAGIYHAMSHRNDYPPGPGNGHYHGRGHSSGGGFSGGGGSFGGGGASGSF